MAITQLQQMFNKLKNSSKKRLVGAWAVDQHTISAVNDAINYGLVEATLVGDKKLMKKFVPMRVLILINLLLFTVHPITNRQ